MHCELCGREIRRGFLIRIEGATLVACADCAERGSVIRPVCEHVQRTERASAPAEVETDIVPVEHYGMLVRRAREARGMRIEELARRLSVPESTLRKIEEEKLVPPLDIARKLEKFFNIRLYEEVRIEHRCTEAEEGPPLTLGDVVRVRWKR